MKKKIFTRPVTLVLNEEIFEQIKQITDSKDISISEWVRKAIDRELFQKKEGGGEMKEQTPVATPALTVERLHDSDLLKEYLDYLKSKLKKNQAGDYCCPSSTSINAFNCWDNTEEFCKEKRLDSKTVVYLFTVDFGCESNVANSLNLDAFRSRIQKLWKGR